jgi:hypothetical protein
MKKEIRKKMEALRIHLALKEDEIRQDKDMYPDEFLIRLSAREDAEEYQVEVVTESVAITNTYSFHGTDEGGLKFIPADEVSRHGIGNYWFMRGSKYLFRWM